MADEAQNEAAAAPRTASPKKKKARKAVSKEERGQSTIPFPYQDLENGITIARAILGAGGVALTRDQLAGAMNLSASSGNFVLKVATARMFGLINNIGGKYELSQLGFSIVDPGRHRAARAEAFLNVPLYKRAYEEFKGKQLPPRPRGLENAFIKFGVPPKQADRARLIFDKSATQAGFFPNGPERLIEPIISGPSIPAGEPSEPEEFTEVPAERPSPGRPVPDRAGKRLHPFIQGLLDTLPEADTTWTIEGRAKWLQAAAHCFDLIYKGAGEVTITAKPAGDHPLASTKPPHERPEQDQ